MLTKEEALAKVEEARKLLDQAESALIDAVGFLEEKGDGDEFYNEAGDVFGVVRDHIGDVEDALKKID